MRIVGLSVYARSIASNACVRSGLAKATATLRNNAEDMSNPAPPSCGFTSGRNSSSGLYYFYPGACGRLLNVAPRSEIEKSRGKSPSSFCPLNHFARRRRAVVGISRSHPTILPPLDHSNQRVEFDFPNLRKEPEVRVSLQNCSEQPTDPV